MFFNLINRNYLVIALIISTFAVFWLKTFTYLDPDFGYRLRNGQIVLDGGIEGIRKDPYSYTMPSFEFVEHSWMSAVIIALAYSAAGVGGTALVFSTIALISLAISTATINPKRALAVVSKKVLGKDLWHFGNPIFILSIAILFLFMGVRVQVMSWIFLSTLLFITFEKKRWEQYKYYIPPLFLFWTNLHASFFEGVIVLFIIMFFKIFNFNFLLIRGSYLNPKAFLVKVLGSIKNAEFNTGDIFIFAASLMATLVNPYGMGAWNKVLSVAGNNSLRWNINEWMPAFVSFDLGVIAFTSVSVMFVLRYLKKFRIEQVVLYFLILIQGLLSVRHMPLWIIISYPMTSEAIYYFWKEVGEKGKSKELFNKAFRIFWGAAVLISIINISLHLYGAYGLSEKGYYPEKAIEFLKTNLPEGRIFSTYGWGGYLTWKLPEKKIFVSGLMPVWEHDDAPAQELKSAYGTYRNIISGEEDYRPVFKKLNIDTVLWNPSEGGGGGMVDKLLGSALQKSGLVTPTFNFEEALKEDGWVVTYRDENSTMLQKR